MKSFARLMVMMVALAPVLAVAADADVHAGGNGKKAAADDPKQNERSQYVGLLEYTAVQNALGLDESQKKKIADVNKTLDDSVPNPDSIRELPAHHREAELHAWETKAEQLKAKLGDVLTEKQLQRLREIALQLRLKIRAGTLLAEKSLSEKLSLSTQQKKELEKLHDQIQQQIAEARETLMKTGAQAGEVSHQKADRFRDEFRRIREGAYQKAVKLLTPEQKEKLSKLTGKMVDINIDDLLAEQSARVEKWTSRWRKQSGSANEEKQPAATEKSSPEHPVGTATEDSQGKQ